MRSLTVFDITRLLKVSQIESAFNVFWRDLGLEGAIKVAQTGGGDDWSEDDAMIEVLYEDSVVARCWLAFFDPETDERPSWYVSILQFSLMPYAEAVFWASIAAAIIAVESGGCVHEWSVFRDVESDPYVVSGAQILALARQCRAPLVRDVASQFARLPLAALAAPTG